MASKELKAEIETVGRIHDLLNIGIFSGQHAKDVMLGQGYLRVVHDQLQKHARAEEERLGDEMAPSFTETVKAQVHAV